MFLSFCNAKGRDNGNLMDELNQGQQDNKPLGKKENVLPFSFLLCQFCALLFPLKPVAVFLSKDSCYGASPACCIPHSFQPNSSYLSKLINTMTDSPMVQLAADSKVCVMPILRSGLATFYSQLKGTVKVCSNLTFQRLLGTSLVPID